MNSERIERKLAAIVAADVAGYSRLMAADEEGTLARLKAHRKALIDPKIVEHSGRIIKTTGDGMLIEFASVVDAVRCVVEIQRGMLERNADIPSDKRIDFRVGINIGDVIVDGEDIYGDGVNVAARMESLAEPGSILVSGVVRDQVRDKLSFSFDDLGDRNVKNIPRPVRAYRVNLSDDGRPSAPAAKASRGLGLVGAAVLLLVVVAGGAAWYLFIANRPVAVATSAPAPVVSNAPVTPEAARLSLVVLPFTNLSGDPSQDYFADGITENLTTDLSRIHNSFVIARNTAFTFKGKSIDAKEIGKELGVRYVLEGSVQREQNRVRVNAQLIDAETGAHLWADRFEEDVADLFKLQDQVVARLANSLGNELFKAEAAKGARSKNPDAVDLTLRGEALLQEAFGNKDKNDAARALFEQALKIDPNQSEALAGEADTYTNENAGPNAETNDFLSIRRAHEAKILDQVDRAIALAPDSVRPYAAKAWYLFAAHRWDEALRATDAGLATNPNSAPLYAQRGWIESELGRFEQAKSDVLQAMRLSPRDPDIGAWHLDLGNAELGLGHYDTAIEEFHRADNTGCCGEAAPLSLAAVYALAGKIDEAKSALAEARRREPKHTAKWLLQAVPSVLVEGLRKAGLAEE
jgi:TolB-like protein/class 3 adenylate cyclase/Tfp pilus assembly protein PilF